MAAPSDAQAWGYRYGGWGGVGAGLAIGALAGGLIAASTARAYAYPAYGYGYGYPAYGYGYAPAQVVVVRRRVVAPAYYGGYYPASYGYGGYYGGYGVRRVGYYGGYGVRRVGYTVGTAFAARATRWVWRSPRGLLRWVWHPPWLRRRRWSSGPLALSRSCVGEGSRKGAICVTEKAPLFALSGAKAKATRWR